jgi:uncharacterized protein (UPF0332 family)
MSTGIARAREELFAAQLLGTTGFAAQAVALAFRSALAGAEAALMLLDKAPEAEPAAVVSAFVRHVVRERGLDPDAGRLLRSLFNRAEQAHDDGVVPHAEASTAIKDATTVVDVVDAWIEASNRVRQQSAAAAPPHPQARQPRPRRPR